MFLDNCSHSHKTNIWMMSKLKSFTILFLFPKQQFKQYTFSDLNKQRAEQPILLHFCSLVIFCWHVGKVIWRTISQWFCSLKNVCLLIIYFSTNNSIIITKRDIRNFLSQLSRAPAISSQQTPKKHSNFLEKPTQNQ